MRETAERERERERSRDIEREREREYKNVRYLHILHRNEGRELETQVLNH